MYKMNVTYQPLIKAGIFLGVGFGGFVDGILFHQLLQVHNMLSARVPKTNIANVEVNMFWDGLFHAFTWITTVAGLSMLWRAGKRADVPWATKTFIGSLFVGWGLFNFVEGVVDHYLLNLHHVVERLGQSVYDVVFLASGLVFILGGWIAIHRDAQHEVIFHPMPSKA